MSAKDLIVKRRNDLDSGYQEDRVASAASSVLVTDVDGYPKTILQSAFPLSAGALAAIAATPAWSPTIVGPTGGGATKLDGQAGVLDASTIFTLNRLVLLNMTNLGVQGWVLIAGTDAPSDTVIPPTNYDAITFPYVFKRFL